MQFPVRFQFHLLEESGLCSSWAFVAVTSRSHRKQSRAGAPVLGLLGRLRVRRASPASREEVTA